MRSNVKPGRWRKRPLRHRLSRYEQWQLDQALERMQQDPVLRVYLRTWDQDHRASV